MLDQKLDQKRVGEFIAKLRKERGLTQSALAEALCVTHQAVSKWENGASLPDPEVLMAMRGVFGVSVDNILDGHVPDPTPVEAPDSSASDQAGANAHQNIVTEDRIVVFDTLTFESPVRVHHCTIHGQAHFKADVVSDTVTVTGHGMFDGSITAAQFAVPGAARVGKQVQADVISVAGSLAAGGGVSCDKLHSSGQMRCGGGMECDAIHNSGALAVAGGVTADELSSTGEMTVGGGVDGKEMKNIGVAAIGGGITSHEFISKGVLTLGGGLHADTVTLSGQFRLGGGISATRASITLSESDCKAAGISAQNLEIKRSCDFPGGILKVGDVTADHADVENLHADKVKIQTGRIGDGCRIRRLQCGPDVEIAPAAEIGEVTRSDGQG